MTFNVSVKGSLPFPPLCMVVSMLLVR